MMMAQHKWAKEINAWAAGAEIETLHEGVWKHVFSPAWTEFAEYRIKPQPKNEKPQYMYVYRMAGQHNVEFRFWDTKSDAPTYVGKIKLEVDDGSDVG
jgi:hypothetical protein